MDDTHLEHALEVAASLATPMPDKVYYTPGNCALLIGPTALLLKRLEVLKVAGLRAALLCTDLADPDTLPRGLRALAGRPATITGWMGAFHAHLDTALGQVDLAPLSWHADGHFDWVIDFSGLERPAVPPLGWYSLPPDDYPALKMALLEIARRLREGYEKPRYFRLDASLCAHRRQGVAGCQACLAVCPAGAIRSDNGSVSIEPHLCQGCGTCALVCPAGAVRHVVPGTPQQLARLARMLGAWRAAGGGEVGLWIVRQAIPDAYPDGWVPFEIDEPASLGAEFWLAALAMGCRRVAVDVAGLPAESRRVIETHVAWCRTLLVGLGHPPVLGLAGTAEELAGIPALPDLPSADLQVGDDKRSLLLAALDALIPKPAPAVAIELPAGPLGEVHIAADRCTLCAACVRLCPTGALSLPGSKTQLAFTEERCLQCGLCANSCPEQAVSLAPRLLVDPAARRIPRVVAEAEPYTCTACGKPFATQAQVARSQALMSAHPMFQGEKARLMTLCAECRQKAVAGIPL